MNNYLVVESFGFSNKPNEKEFNSFNKAWDYIETAAGLYARTVEVMEDMPRISRNKEAGYANVITTETDRKGNVKMRCAEWKIQEIMEEN